MRKKLIRIIKYTIISIAIFIFIIIISLFVIWSLFLIKDSVSFNPTKNISITLSGFSVFPKISLKNVAIQVNDYNTDVEFQNIQLQSFIKNRHIYIEACNIYIDTPFQPSHTTKEERKSNQKKDVFNFQSFFTYLPQKLFVKNISVFIKNTERTFFISGIPLTIDKAQNLISFSSTDAVMGIVYNGQKKSITGTVDIYYKFLQDSQEIGSNIQFSPYMLARAKVTFDNTTQKINMEDIYLSLDENVSQSLSPLLRSVFSFPVDWQKIQINNLHGSFYYQNARWIPKNINGYLSCSSLKIGDKEKPWLHYTSEIHIHSQYIENEKITEVVMNTDKDPLWEMNWKYNHGNQNTFLDFSCRTIQGKTIQNISPFLYHTFLLKQIEPFSAECSLSLQGLFPALGGNIRGKLSLFDVNNIQLNSSLKISPSNNGSNSMKWSGDVNILSNPIHFSAEFTPPTSFISHIHTENLPTKFIQSLTPSLVKNVFDKSLADMDITIKGTDWKNMDLQFKGELTSGNEDEEYLPIVPSQFHFQGTIQNLDTLVGAFHLSSENSADFELNPCTLHLFPLSLEGDVKTKVYLSTIALEFIPFYIPGKASFG
ncbi:MAG: hypothetical protein ACP5KS_01205, partial [Candidatus Hydrogenedens sp.]